MYGTTTTTASTTTDAQCEKRENFRILGANGGSPSPVILSFLSNFRIKGGTKTSSGKTSDSRIYITNYSIIIVFLVIFY